ncbi:unnamed protein product [Urochloa humidicola]
MDQNGSHIPLEVLQAIRLQDQDRGDDGLLLLAGGAGSDAGSRTFHHGCISQWLHRNPVCPALSASLPPPPACCGAARRRATRWPVEGSQYSVTCALL